MEDQNFGDFQINVPRSKSVSKFRSISQLFVLVSLSFGLVPPILFYFSFYWSTFGSIVVVRVLESTTQVSIFYQLSLELVVGCSKRATSKCWDIDSQGWYYYRNLGMDHRYYIKGLLAFNKGSPTLQGAPMALRGVNRLS